MKDPERARRTVKGSCVACGGAIAWRQAGREWQLHDAARGTDGAILRRPETIREPDGTSRVVMRRIPAGPHVCAAETAESTLTGSTPARVTLAPPMSLAPLSSPASTLVGSTPVTGSPVVAVPAVGAPAATVAEPEPEPLPTVESLLPAGVREQWQRFEDALTAPFVIPPRVLAYGGSGIGKSETPSRVAAAKGWGLHFQLLTEETPAGDLAGHLIVQGGSTAWLHGSLGRAIVESHERPVIYVLDEIGRASADALSYALLATSDPRSLRLVMRNGETIMPKPENWHVVATSNDLPETLPDPLRDRLHLAIRLDGPAPGLVESLTTPEARRLACAASREYSIRALVTYDGLRAQGWSVDKAARLVWEPETAESLIDAVRLEAARPRIRSGR